MNQNCCGHKRAKKYPYAMNNKQEVGISIRLYVCTKVRTSVCLFQVDGDSRSYQLKGFHIRQLNT